MAITFRAETKGGVLDIEKEYKMLAEFAMGPDSPYLRAKDTLLEYFEGVGSKLSDREKADMLVGLIEKTSISMSSELMGTAVKVAMETRDAPYNLAKTVAEVKAISTNSAKVVAETSFTSAKIDETRVGISKTIISSQAEQAAVYSKTGIKLEKNGSIAQISHTISNSLATDVVAGKSGRASMYAGLAASYRASGKDVGVKIVEDSAGKLTLAVSQDDMSDSTDYGLTWAQTKVAVRQEKGFDDNMIQHAANSSANTIGLLLSSGNDSLIVEEVDGNATGSLEQQYSYALETLLNKA